MRRVFIVGGLVLLVIGAAATFWHFHDAERPQANEPHFGMLEPTVEQLVTLSAAGDQRQDTPFFAVLRQLLAQQGISSDDLHPVFVQEGRAFRWPVDKAAYIVAVLQGCTPTVPGSDTQRLLLLDQHGKLLDTLACTVSSRVTRMYTDGAGYQTEPQADEIVIRLQPKE